MEKRKTTQLRELIKGEGLLILPQCYDASSARILEDIGFKAVNVGGFGIGVTLGVTEHLLTMSEMVMMSKYIASSIDLPVLVDANGGFGSVLHVQRTIREFEQAGVAGVFIEDQYFPKRAHYFKNIKHTIEVDEMVSKIKAAIEAKTDPDFVIIARTDSYFGVGGGLEEAIRRGNIYLEAGADAIMPASGGAKNLEDAARLAKGIHGPIEWSLAEYNIGVADEYMNATATNIENMGYKILKFPLTATLVTAKAVIDNNSKLFKNGVTGLDRQEAKELRTYVETLKGVEEHVAIEKKYGVEKEG